MSAHRAKADINPADRHFRFCRGVFKVTKLGHHNCSGSNRWSGHTLSAERQRE